MFDFGIMTRCLVSGAGTGDCDSSGWSLLSFIVMTSLDAEQEKKSSLSGQPDGGHSGQRGSGANDSERDRLES